ncbi:MAG: TetR/AcrR family transcriptional regulator [Solidesulfovibrio sp. DCME]|uniref:TetR/AcrR family transcriptional regulator n=1 Tax=Solidesulfovibrio sp. DCME TaxID=3447380 RepID=UPI003D14D40D
MPQEPKPDARRAILVAAIGLFAEKGYAAATVRDLCARAGGVNVSAVNYYFGGKGNLYAEILRLMLTGLFDGARPGPTASGEAPTGEDALRAFVTGYCRMLYGSGPLAIDLGRIYAREMLSPSPFLDAVARQTLAPGAQELLDLLRPLLGPDPAPGLVRRAAAFTIGTITYFAYNNEAFRRIFPDHPDITEAWEETAEEACAFILGGLARLAVAAPREDHP